MLIDTGFGYKENIRGDRDRYRDFKEKNSWL
jgi:hypothetical protein